MSKSQNGVYCKSNVPWEKMKKEGKYTGMIEILEMKKEEIEEFKDLLSDETGTVIKFRHNDFLQDEILKQFKNQNQLKNLIKE